MEFALRKTGHPIGLASLVGSTFDARFSPNRLT
jgi:hypothetical protein